MATVELRFSALPAHVRTARLVAAAVARRSGVDEAVLDEVRLAVGEACSRAVHLHRLHCPHTPVTVTLVDEDKAFQVTVIDEAPRGGDEAEGTTLADLASSADLEDPVVPGMGLAVITGLVEDLAVERGADHGLVVRMRWPTTA